MQARFIAHLAGTNIFCMKSLCLMMLSVFVFASGCSAQKPPVTTPGSGISSISGKWLVTKILSDSVPLEVASLDMYAELDSAGGRISGRGACNRFFGSLKISGSDIQSGALGGTMMACPSLDTEQKLYSLLQKAEQFKIVGGLLQIEAGKQTLLELIPYPVKNLQLDEGMAETNTPLDLYKWNFLQMVSADSIINLSSLKANISFDSNQKLQGFAGCNRFFGSFSLQPQFNSGSISLGNIGSTRMACPQLSLESQILAGLQSITRYEIRNKTLLLFNHDTQLFLLRANPKQE
jgi:heat shock protein HslJ